jgi:ABC-type phosphate transport system substrate-binding protein
LNSCSSNSNDPAIKVSVPGDLYYLGAIINDASSTDAGVPPVQVNFSEDRINDLKQGKTDAVLLGREPTADELKGLKDYVIAIDAVCIIVDQNSYVGGQYLGNGHPTVKTDGLKNLTTQDLTQIFSGPTSAAWSWNGEYDVRDPLLDPNSWMYSDDTLAWIKQPAQVLHPFNFPVGEFDTQSVIYQDLGLNEKSEVSHNGSYLDPKLHLEEEVLSFEYNGQIYSASQNGSQNFVFKLGFASRRVMTIAPQHVPVSVVSVNGINPMTNPQSIYDGTYKFSRKIYLLIRQNSPGSAVKLADFLQSPSGQKLITDAGYLPIVESK